MISERHKRQIVSRYRAGLAARTFRRRDPGPITIRPQDRDNPDEVAFRVVRETLGEGVYRFERLPTADEQLTVLRDEE